MLRVLRRVLFEIFMIKVRIRDFFHPPRAAKMGPFVKDGKQ